ncbi:MAG TPA: RNA polymerase sigma factor, partial [Gemmataceae bacterium]|nr:RNA polymerase sigma factor [Gemmataceae bacterium]
MSSQSLQPVVRHLRKLAGVPPGDEPSDRELLDRFTGCHDQAAFAALVRRHGPTVLGVCRRVLRQGSDVEDAFQATFLVLLRKARSIRKRPSLASWLYGVAYRTASRARAAAARSAPCPSETGSRSADDPCLTAAWRELCLVLDAELQGLPERYRAPLVLCYLQDRTRDQAARHLGWSLRTFDRRLGQARELLRARLTRRGLTLSAAFLATGLATEAAGAAVPALLVSSTLKTAMVFAGSGAVSAKVAALAKGAVEGMAAAKLKVVTALLLAASVIMAGVGLAAHQALPAKEPEAKQAGGAAPRTTRQTQPSAKQPARTDRYGDPLPEDAVARIGTLRLRGTGYFLAFLPGGKSLLSDGLDGTVR